MAYDDVLHDRCKQARRTRRPWAAAYVGTLPVFHDADAELLLSIYGPRGGTKLCVPISLAEAKLFRTRLDAAISDLEHWEAVK